MKAGRGSVGSVEVFEEQWGRDSEMEQRREGNEI